MDNEMLCEMNECGNRMEYTGPGNQNICGKCMEDEINFSNADPEDFFIIEQMPISEHSNHKKSEFNPLYTDEEIAKANGGLIIFEENMTAAGLEKIQAEALNWPKVAETKQQYDQIYSDHQRFKRLRLAVTKKKTELTKTEKQKFESEKTRINVDYDFVMSVLAPLEKQLADSRQEWGNRIKAEAEEKAKIEADRQKAEWERQENIRLEKIRIEEAERKAKADERERLLKIEADRLEKIESERQAAAAEKEKQQELEAQQLEASNIALEKAAAELARQRFEFECEKSRVDFETAWNYYYSTPIDDDGRNIQEFTENQEARQDLERNMKMTPRAEQKTPLQAKQDGDYAPDVFAAQAKPEPVKLFSLADYEAIKFILKNSTDTIGQLIAHQEAGVKNTELNIEISNFLNRLKSAKRIFANKYENLI